MTYAVRSLTWPTSLDIAQKVPFSNYLIGYLCDRVNSPFRFAIHITYQAEKGGWRKRAVLQDS